MAVVTAAVTFPMSYDTLVADAAKLQSFKSSVVSSVAAAAKVPAAWVNVTGVRKGSVVADVAITVPAAEHNSESLSALGTAVTANPEVVFMSVKSAFGITQPITATVKSIEQPRSTAQSASAVGIGVGVAVGGVAALVVGAATVIIIKRRRAQQLVPAAAAGVNPAVP